MAERPFRKPRSSSLYEVLQVAPRAAPEVIQASYRTLARIYHPDVSDDPESAVRMREINAAYDVLGDSAKRAQYDAEHAWAAKARTFQSPTRSSMAGPGASRARPATSAHAVTVAASASPASRGRLLLLVLALLGILTLLLWLVLELLNEAPTPLLV